MCDTISEFLGTLLKEFKGIKISQNQLAEEIGISVNSLRKWKKEEKTHAQLEENTNLDKTVLPSIYRYAGTIPKSTKVPEDVRQRIAKHFGSYLGSFCDEADLCQQSLLSRANPTTVPESEGKFLRTRNLFQDDPNRRSDTRTTDDLLVKSSTIFITITQWHDIYSGSIILANPFRPQYEQRKIRIRDEDGIVFEMADISVRSEYLYYRQDNISLASNVNEQEVKLQWDSRGKIEILKDGITELSEDVDRRWRFRNDSDDSARLIFKVNSTRPFLNYSARIVNGFYRYPDFSVKTLDNLPTDMMRISVNYAFVYDKELSDPYNTDLGMKLDRMPGVDYLVGDVSKGKEIEVKQGDMTWTALVESLEPNSRIRMWWP